MRKTIIFDFDGVVIDSTAVQEQAFYESYRRIVGEGNPSFEEYLSHSGNSIENIFKKMNLPLEMIPPYREISRKCIDKIKVFDGVNELIIKLKEQNYKIGICTGKDRERTVEILINLGFYSEFDAIVCSDEVKNPKPHPESLLLSIARLNSTIEDSVMVGDAVYDIRCAQQAGVKSIAVTWGISPQDVLVQEAPDYMVDTVVQLEECISKIA